MKKITLLLIICLTLLTYAGCKNKLTDKEKIEKQLDEVLNQVTIDVSGCQYLLPTNFPTGITYYWQSNNKDLIDHFGHAKSVYLDEDVTLTLTLTLNNQTKSKNFICNPYKDMQSYRQTQDAQDLQILQDFTNNLTIKLNERKYLLNKTIPNDILISIISNKPLLVNNQGEIINSSVNEEVELTFTFTKNHQVIDKVFILNPYNDIKTLNDQAILDDIINNFMLPARLDNDFNLIALDQTSALITLITNKPTIITNEGIVNHIATDEEVIITFTFTYEGLTGEKQITTIVEKDILQTPEYQRIQNVINNLNIPSQTITNINLPNNLNDVMISWQSDNETYLTNEGVVSLPDNVDELVKLSASFTYNSYNYNKKYEIIVLSNRTIKINELNEKIINFTMITETKEDVELSTNYNGVSISWRSLSLAFISSNGKINRTDIDQTANLSATFSYQGVSIKKTFTIIIKAYTIDEQFKLIFDSITFPTIINQDLELQTSFNFNIQGSWMSNNQTIINNEGKIFPSNKEETVILTLKLIKGESFMSKEFEVKTAIVHDYSSDKPHQVIVKAVDFTIANLNNLCYDSDKIVLQSGQLNGTYESGIINTIDFVSLVVSWASTSSITSTAQIYVKVLVDNVWSEYITYYPWGFGLENKCYDQQNSLIKLSYDEVIVLNNKKANAIMFKIELKRNSIQDLSPAFSLISFALESKNYQYQINTSTLPNEKLYNVPRLYQQVVPSIGGSICSATTSTMLLKYKGEDFSSFDTYEHRYIAYKVKEYNTGIFGNWVYNTVCMSSFGYDAYVARMYSIEELIAHLANVGPCGLSVKGQMVSNLKTYTTNGHLIVAVGYKYVNDQLIILCNDPNVSNVLCEYTSQVIMNTWKGVSYIIK